MDSKTSSVHFVAHPFPASEDQLNDRLALNAYLFCHKSIRI